MDHRNVRTFGADIPFSTLRRTILIAVLCTCALQARPQLLDSIALFARQAPRPVLKLDSRGSFINNENVGMMGVKIGLEHAGRFQYGVGYSFLRTRVEELRPMDDQQVALARFRFGYVTPYVEYAFYQRGPWEVRIPVQFGLGAASWAYEDQEGHRQRDDRSFIFLYEPSMTVQYRFLTYFGANIGWGYRLVFGGKVLGERLTAPIYLYGIKVFFGDLWRDLQR